MKRYALLTANGTACDETVLTEAEYNDPAARARAEARALSQQRPGYDMPVAGTWTDVTANEACEPAESKAEALGYVLAADGYWFHKSWKDQPGWQDRPWLDTAEDVLEYEAINAV